ncbi:hypothetical protein GJ496_011884 [Pomphorhynchus laevis]|nr:hypothetical protein GJ496_011884 [Pomphorhynchus laevis]
MSNNQRPVKRKVIEMPVDSNPTGYDLNLKIEKILGIARKDKEFMYLVKWQGVDQSEFVPRTIMNEKYAQDVIAYLNSLIQWCDYDPDEDGICRHKTVDQIGNNH